VIWETGLGGRLDATNIVTPLASVITNIALDHQPWLGDTVEKIAAEKAGIIKPGVPVVTAAEDSEALAVIERAAREKNAPLTTVAADGNPPLTRFAALFRDAATLPLLGEHQKTNAALALETVQALQGKIPVSDEAIRSGLESVNWPGRLQLITGPSGQRILLDGAHNVAGVKALREALESCNSNFRSAGSPLMRELQRAGPEAGAPQKFTFIIGILGDKDWRPICEVLAPLAARIFTVPVASERTADPRALAAACRAVNPAARIDAGDSLAEALTRSEGDAFTIITGSLYLVGEALEILGLSPANGGERVLNEWTAPAVPANNLI
jgi:dihydrofolate synthase/folylpolyglutamate synthase